MITEEERQSIINEAVERTLLSIPEVIGNLMASHAALAKINKKFYDDYPEFKNSKDVVASVVEVVEGKNPIDNYDKILRDAVPEIRRRIATTKSLDMTNVPRPNRDLSHGEL